MTASVWKVVESAANNTAGRASISTSAQVEESDWAHLQQSAVTTDFYHAWLGVQCRFIPDARRAVLFLATGEEGGYVAIASWPKRDDPPEGLLLDASQRALKQGSDVILYQEAAQQLELSRLHIAHIFAEENLLLGAVVLEIAPCGEDEREQVLRQLRWGATWIGRLQARQDLAARSKVFDRFATAMHATATVLAQSELKSSAMALVNELTEKFHCERVSVGLIRNDRVKVLALSHAANFQEKTNLLTGLRRAMEETVVTGQTVRYRGEDARYPAHHDLMVCAAPRDILSVPLRQGHESVGALILERDDAQAFSADEVLLVEAVADVIGPTLRLKQNNERSLPRQVLDAVKNGGAKLVGPRHALVKFVVALIMGALSFMTFVSGEHRVTARTVVEGSVQRAAVAPFDGFVAESFVRAGDTVKAGQALCVLDDKDLKLEWSKWSNEKQQLDQKIREAMANADRSALGVLTAQAAQADAQVALAQEKLARTRILAPFDGVVVSGDLSQLLGSPVEIGKVLFQVAPLQKYRVILKVDDRDIAGVAPSQRGELVLAGLSRQRLPFQVKTITSVATQEEGRNFFRVEAQMEHAPDALRPGMEGIGKILIGERSLLWVWTHSFVDWLRLQWWSLLP